MALPRWISDVNAASPPNAYIVPPTEAKKDVGFDAGEKMAAQYVNWFWSDLEKWLRANIGNRTIHLPAAAGVADDMTKLDTGLWAWTPSVNQEIAFALPVAVGETITSVRAWVKGGSGSNLSAQLMKTVGTSAGASVTTAAVTSGSGDQILTLNLFDGTPDTVGAAEWYSVLFTAGATTADQKIYGLEVVCGPA